MPKAKQPADISAQQPELQQPEMPMAQLGYPPLANPLANPMYGQMPQQIMPQQMMPQQMMPQQMMMQMMQAMMGMGGGLPMVDPSALPFAVPDAAAAADKGLEAAIIRPAMLSGRIKTQQPLPTGSTLDLLCLSSDGAHALGGLPKGCTIALAGPPGKGKTRTALAALARVAASGMKCALVVAEEGFHDNVATGRDDLCSRLVKLGMGVTGMTEEQFAQTALANLYVLESQYHKGQRWDDFIQHYRYVVEKLGVKFVVIDSLNMLDPQKNRTADNLSALKTYSHEHGVTCLCIGQIRDTGLPVGGEALMHTADAVFLLEELSLGSKEIAEFWGGKYRETIDVIRAIKCVTTPIFPHQLRITLDNEMGVLAVHPAQPASYAPPALG